MLRRVNIYVSVFLKFSAVTLAVTFAATNAEASSDPILEAKKVISKLISCSDLSYNDERWTPDQVMAVDNSLAALNALHHKKNHTSSPAEKATICCLMEKLSKGNGQINRRLATDPRAGSEIYHVRGVIINCASYMVNF